MARKQLMIPVIILVLIFGIVAAVLGKWDWLLWGMILLCPLIHLFGHNHSGHSDQKNSESGHHHKRT